MPAIILRILYRFLKLVAFIILFICVLLGIPYLTTVYYKFPEIKQFSGTHIYNPYAGLDSFGWHKAIFHLHSKAWGGSTNGRKNSDKRLDSIYTYLNYDIIATSDYMKINTYAKGKSAYLPVYEHGYGIFKNHQLCIGAKKAGWRDFFYFQNIHHKQHILNYLKPDNELVFIAHPKFQNAYSPDDFKYLTNYDGIEVLNNLRTSTEHWDAALSTGHYVTLISNDDAHNLDDPNEAGHHCTFVNTPNLQANAITNALKQGQAFGAEIHRNLGESYQEKKKKLSRIAKLVSVNLYNDTIHLVIDRPAAEIRFIGQNGIIKHTVQKSSEAKYYFTETDTYIRMEMDFANGNKFYLNPLARMQGETFTAPALQGVNYVKTLIFRILSFLILALATLLLFYLGKSIIK